MEWTVPAEEAGERLDKWLLLKLAGRSRSNIQRLIEQERVLVNGKPRSSHHLLRADERVTVQLENLEEAGPQAVALDLTVLFEDEHLLVIDKPQGLSVHASTRREEVTVVNGLLARGIPLSSLGDADRPGIVHRLDKHTSGILVVAKTNVAHAALGEAFRLREVEKQYTALVNGALEADEYVVDAPIARDPRRRERMAVTVGGERHALTVVRAVQRFRDFTLVHAEPRSGRTHQIRVHLVHLGHPIVGDTEYGGRNRALAAAERRGDPELHALLEALPGQLLHANRLRFQHPVRSEPLELSSPMPPVFQSVLDRLAERHAA